MKIKKNYIVIALIAVAVALIGSAFTQGGMDWYDGIYKTPWTPAGGFIGSVWTIIFMLTALSAIIAWNKHGSHAHDSKKCLVVSFSVNAVLNMAWSYVFFQMHNMGAAALVAFILALSVLWMMNVTRKISKNAAYLLLPYFLWVCFATYLNYVIWAINI